MMAEIDEEYEISDSITALGKLLRYSMRWISGNAVLRDELEYIRNYLTLINLRYDFEVILSVNLPEELLDQEIPKMSLQPIVENAVLHGIEPVAEDTTVYIKGWEQDGEFVIEVTDSGRGMTPEELDAIVKAMGAEKGDLLVFAADKLSKVRTVMGQVRLELGRSLDLIDKNAWKFLWVTEFPLLEWSDEENRFMAMHHPFTAPMDEDWQYIDSDPGRVRAKAYDIVLNGTELGGGSVRIHQADIQEKMLEVLGFTPEKANEQFGFLLEAFKYGVPPHAGLAYGLDRVAMWMTGAETIRDCMAFPKLKDASDAMMGAPSEVDVKQLDELGIEKKEREA